MAELIIRGPEGAPIARMRVPEGATDDQIAAKVKEIKGQIKSRQNASRFAEYIDTSPQERAYFPDRQMRKADQQDRLTRLDNAADTGVDVNTGLPLSIRARASLVERDPEAAIDYIDYEVRKQINDAGIEVPDEVPVVYRDTYTDELTYLRPFERDDGTVGLRPTLADEGGPVSLGDFADLAGDVAAAAPEVAGAIGLGAIGAAASGPGAAIVGGAAGAAQGAYYGTILRREMAKELGVPEEIANRITNDDALADALTAAGLELAVPAVIGGVRRIINRYRYFDPEDAEHMASLKENAARVNESLKTLEEETGVVFQPTVATLTGDPALLVQEQNIRRRVVGKKSEALAEAEVRNRLASAKALEQIHRQHIDDTVPYIEDSGEIARGIIQDPKQAVARRVEAQELSLEELADQADEYRNIKPYLHLQDDVAAAKDTAIKAEDAAWDYFRQQIEVNREGVANIALRNPEGSPVRQVLKALNADSQRALLTQISKEQKSLLNNAGFQTGGGLESELLDMRQVHSTLSWLNRRIRHTENQVDPDGFNLNDLRALRSALRDQFTQSGIFQRTDTNLRNRVGDEKAAEIIDAFEAANHASRVRHDLYDNDTIQRIVETKQMPDGSTRFVQQPENVAALVLKPNDPRPLADVMDVVGGNLDVRVALAKEWYRHFRGSVLDDAGRFMKGAYRKFMDQYSGHMRLLGINPENIRNVQDATKVMERLERRAKRVDEALTEVYGRTLTGKEKYGGNLVRDIMTQKLTTKQAAALKRRLNNAAPEVWADIQRRGSEWLQNELTGKAQKVTNTTQLDNILTDHSDRLRVIYGEGYVRNLRALRDAMSLVDNIGSARGTRREMTPPLLQMTRALMGPLSKKQRFISATQKAQQRIADNVLYGILTNPDNLDRFMKLAPLPADSVVRVAGLTALGIPEGFLEPEAQEVLRRREYEQRRRSGNINARQ